MAEMVSKKQVLIAGPAAFLETARKFFSNRRKFSVTMAEDGDAVLASLESQPGFALFDIDLPKKGGDECCRLARKQGLAPATNIVLIVSPESHRDIGRCLDAGCDAILPKPVSYEGLAGVVRRLLFNETYVPSRFPVRLPVRHGILPRTMTYDYSANLTTRGVFIETAKTAPVGSSINVVFTIPHGGMTIECRARVAWLNDQLLRKEPLLPAGMGLEFMDMDDRQVNAISDFLYQLAIT